MRHWVRQRVKVLTCDFIDDVSTHAASELIASFSSRPYSRLRGDFKCEHGDGGVAHLKFPIYTIADLGLSAKANRGLCNNLHRIGAQRNDWHDCEPIQNIIDPDLCPAIIDLDVAFSGASMLRLEW